MKVGEVVWFGRPGSIIQHAREIGPDGIPKERSLCGRNPPWQEVRDFPVDHCRRCQAAVSGPGFIWRRDQ